MVQTLEGAWAQRQQLSSELWALNVFCPSQTNIPISTQLVFQFNCSGSNLDSFYAGSIVGVAIAGPITDILGRRGGMVRILVGYATLTDASSQSVGGFIIIIGASIWFSYEGAWLSTLYSRCDCDHCSSECALSSGWSICSRFWSVNHDNSCSFVRCRDVAPSGKVVLQGCV